MLLQSSRYTQTRPDNTESSASTNMIRIITIPSTQFTVIHPSYPHSNQPLYAHVILLSYIVTANFGWLCGYNIIINILIKMGRDGGML